MKIIAGQMLEPVLDENAIYISQSMKDYLIQGKVFWPVMLRGFKRVLRARMSATSLEEMTKLQGKLELISELENFFQLNE